MFNKLRKRKPPSSAQPAGGNGRQSIIDLRQVIKSFSVAAGEFTVLKGIDAAIYPSEFVAVIGKSGSGKSTPLAAMRQLVNLGLL